jgi:hypothetical protein
MKKKAIHKNLAGPQPFPGKNHRVTHAPKAVPHLKHSKVHKGHSNSFVATSVATMPKAGGKKSRKRSAIKG